MEDNEDNSFLNLDDNLQDAPPIIQIKIDNDENKSFRNRFTQLKEEKLKKKKLLEIKEKEIYNLKKEIEEIDKKIINMEKEIKILEDKYKKLIKIEVTKEDIEAKQDKIYEDINNVFKEYKQNPNNIDIFYAKLNKIFYNDKIQEFIDMVTEISYKGFNIFNNYEGTIDEIIDKYESFLDIKSAFYSLIKLFFKNHEEEKLFVKKLIGLKKVNEDKIESDLDMLQKSKKIENNLIINSIDYQNASLEKKKLMLNDEINNIGDKINESHEKAKNALKNGNKKKAKRFLNRKKFFQKLNEKYYEEIEKLNK